MKLNRWDGYGCLRYGWCLDWLDRAAESEPYFNRAEELDPNGYFTLANIGLHYVQVGDYAAAKPWFERSLRLEWLGNVISRTYLEIANARLLEAASNGGTGRLEAPAP
jgi:tetratricopeptide (TPR) repeat protein